jgi:uracil-DNA glycosylase
MSLFDQLHPDWQSALEALRPHFLTIERSIEGQVIAPEYENVMRALNTSIESIRVVIIGQDPYPTPGYAHGLAFSVAQDIVKLPASLKNIFKELESDCAVARPVNGDLSRWSDQGVLLLNRVLTTRSGYSLAHVDIGWQVITNEVARLLGERSVIAILWGKSAQELAHYFPAELLVVSAHPSPLSAYRGFFGSRAFSAVNRLLIDRGQEGINW